MVGKLLVVGSDVSISELMRLTAIMKNDYPDCLAVIDSCFSEPIDLDYSDYVLELSCPERVEIPEIDFEDFVISDKKPKTKNPFLQKDFLSIGILAEDLKFATQTKEYWFPAFSRGRPPPHPAINCRVFLLVS